MNKLKKTEVGPKSKCKKTKQKKRPVDARRANKCKGGGEKRTNAKKRGLEGGTGKLKNAWLVSDEEINAKIKKKDGG